MPRDVSLADSKCWNGGQKWVMGRFATDVEIGSARYSLAHKSKNSIKMAPHSIVGTIYAYSVSVSAMEILFGSGNPTK